MQFFLYSLGDESVPLPPRTPEQMAEMGPFMEESMKAGILIATGALAPSSQGVKVEAAGGSFTVTDGPFIEAKELIGGWLLVEVASMQEAISWTKRLLKITGGDARIRPLFGPGDFGSA